TEPPLDLAPLDHEARHRAEPCDRRLDAGERDVELACRLEPARAAHVVVGGDATASLDPAVVVRRGVRASTIRRARTGAQLIGAWIGRGGSDERIERGFALE